ncbi:unnamed protein product, partial [Cuscuta epithymum]
MDFSSFPLVCHWGGNYYENGGQICHEGGRTSFVMVSRGACMVEILQKIHAATMIHLGRSLRLKMKFPMNGGKYMLMPLIDELAITNMWGIIQMEDMSSLEVYIEECFDANATQSTSNAGVSRHDVIAGVNAGKSSKHHIVTLDLGRGIFQVETGCGGRTLGKGGRKQTVHLQWKTCTCKKMEIYKIPCSHVLAVCRQRSLSYAPFVDKFFSSDQYAATYHRVFKPIPDRDYWPNYNGPEIVHDPSMLRAKGRPKSTRIKNEMDEGPRGTVRC